LPSRTHAADDHANSRRRRPARADARFSKAAIRRGAELAAAYVMLADPLSSYVSGATIAVTGGRPFI